MIEQYTNTHKKRGRKEKVDKCTFEEELYDLHNNYNTPTNYASIISFLHPKYSLHLLYNVKKGVVINLEVLRLIKSISKKKLSTPSR